TDEWGGGQNRMSAGVGTMQQQWMKGYQSMLNNMSSGTINPFWSSNYPGCIQQQAQQHGHLPAPVSFVIAVSGQRQNNSFNPHDFWKAIDPAAFRSFVDKLSVLTRKLSCRAL
ncbi:MAG TPA: hypothetical protein VHK69_04630, partial [Chitinophagaceae bacterium]|nr:hypothetical protein [Chitinophagaceae bacterium]